MIIEASERMDGHILKILPEFFDPVSRGLKPFEVRKDDRPGGFQVGQFIMLAEWNPDLAKNDRYTGRRVHAWITYVLRGPCYGIEDGYAVLGLSGEAPQQKEVTDGRGPTQDTAPRTEGSGIRSGEDAPDREAASAGGVLRSDAAGLVSSVATGAPG